MYIILLCNIFQLDCINIGPNPFPSMFSFFFLFSFSSSSYNVKYIMKKMMFFSFFVIVLWLNIVCTWFITLWHYCNLLSPWWTVLDLGSIIYLYLCLQKKNIFCYIVTSISISTFLITTYISILYNVHLDCWWVFSLISECFVYLFLSDLYFLYMIKIQICEMETISSLPCDLILFVLWSTMNEFVCKDCLYSYYCRGLIECQRMILSTCRD